jgi:hypothetical protein
MYLCKKGLLNASHLGKQVKVSGQLYDCMAPRTKTIAFQAPTSHFVISTQSITILN